MEPQVIGLAEAMLFMSGCLCVGFGLGMWYQAWRQQELYRERAAAAARTRRAKRAVEAVDAAAARMRTGERPAVLLMEAVRDD